MKWKDALHRNGAKQVGYAKKLIESRTFFDRIPDQSIIVDNYEGANYIAATRVNDYAFIYCPYGLRFKVKMGVISGQIVKANWYDPRIGEMINIGIFENHGIMEFIPPTAGRGCDWVLVLDGDRAEAL